MGKSGEGEARQLAEIRNGIKDGGAQNFEWPEQKIHAPI
jgi:hypothetical protein